MEREQAVYIRERANGYAAFARGNSMVKDKVIRFREQDNESLLVSEAQALFGLSSESEAARLLVKIGIIKLREMIKIVEACATPLKTSEISNFFSSIKIRLLKERKERKALEAKRI